jgi:rubredoxin
MPIHGPLRLHPSFQGEDKKGKVHPVIAFEELSGGWCCPGCGAKKDKFKCLDE